MENKLRDWTLYLIGVIVFVAFLMGVYLIGQSVFSWSGPSGQVERMFSALFGLCFAGIAFLTVLNVVLNLGVIARSVEVVALRAKHDVPAVSAQVREPIGVAGLLRNIGKILLVLGVVSSMVWAVGGYVDYRQYENRRAALLQMMASVPDSASQIQKIAALVKENGRISEMQAEIDDLAKILSLSKSDLSIVIPQEDQELGAKWFGSR